MGMVKKSVCMILVVLIIALSAVIFLQSASEDRTPPEITFDKKSITVKVADDNSKLLKGVKATDNRDGDISGEVTIDSISDFAADGSRTITYAAVDRSDNVTKKSRKLLYSDYRKPEFTFTDSPVFSSTDSSINIADILQANDVFDGDISSFIRLKDDNIRVGQAGTYFALATVYNSAGDKAELKLPIFIDAVNTNDAPKINLKTYLVYLNKGSQKPNWRKYVDSVRNHSNRSATSSDAATLEKIKIDDGNVDTSKSGCYYVSYEYTNPDKSTSVTRLVVAVR